MRTMSALSAATSPRTRANRLARHLRSAALSSPVCRNSRACCRPRSPAVLAASDSRARRGENCPFCARVHVARTGIFRAARARVDGGCRPTGRALERAGGRGDALGRVRAAADWQLACEIALSAALYKKGSSTNERGKANLLHILTHSDGRVPAANERARRFVRRARAALADEGGKALDAALAAHGVPPHPVKAQPIRWAKNRERGRARRPARW